MVVHALRRLIGRLYQLAKSRYRSEKAEGRLAEARSEILKLDPSLNLVAKMMDELKGSSIAEVEEYEHAQKMLLRFKPRNSEVQPAKRASKSRPRNSDVQPAKRASKSRSSTRKSTRRSEPTTSGRRATAKTATRKTATRKTATKKRTTKKRVAKTKASARRTRP